MKTNEIAPKSYFYTVSVDLELQVDDSGKTKKAKETYLVDAIDVSDAEKKTMNALSGVLGDWDIVSVSKAKINSVIVESEEEC